MWCASLDLRKTCARIGYNAWFDALKVQEVPKCSAPHAFLKSIVSVYHD